MLVKFISSETGELMMFAEMASTLLRVIGKETARRGTFTREEMLPAAKLLREALARGEATAGKADDNGDETLVALGPRAWPLIDMLERSSKGDVHANVVWEAAADF
ncbi:MAG: DUF1840 domain-containing protein [Dechloromonas sp.]|nr:DUF1840 domain-containing protein [Dechloromonas sp.]